MRHVSFSAMAWAVVPLMAVVLRSDSYFASGFRYPPFPVGGSGCRHRALYPGRPKPHITRDPLGAGGFTVRVKGIRPKPWRLREFDPAAPNYKGSRYEKLARARALISEASAL